MQNSSIFGAPRPHIIIQLPSAAPPPCRLCRLIRVASCRPCRHSCLPFAYNSAHALSHSLINWHLNKLHLKTNGHPSKIEWKPFLKINHRRTPRLYFSLIILSILARLELHFISIWLPLGSILAHFGSILELLGLHLASQGLPLGTVGSLWAAGCPQEGSNERKAGSLDPPWVLIWQWFSVNFSMKFR